MFRCSLGSASMDSTIESTVGASSSFTSGSSLGAAAGGSGVVSSVAAGASSAAACSVTVGGSSRSSQESPPSSSPPFSLSTAITSGLCIKVSGSSSIFIASLRSPFASCRVTFHRGSFSSISSSLPDSRLTDATPFVTSGGTSLIEGRETGTGAGAGTGTGAGGLAPIDTGAGGLGAGGGGCMKVGVKFDAAGLNEKLEAFGFKPPAFFLSSAILLFVVCCML
mmetsp:Transcript_2378/g.3351  ORF Transcript_2378/g.3351 Transcript_2378/m.3351 type:complete len:223 (-) Transcript_2378:184-852(-)